MSDWVVKAMLGVLGVGGMLILAIFVTEAFFVDDSVAVDTCITLNEVDRDFDAEWTGGRDAYQSYSEIADRCERDPEWRR